MKNTNVKIEYTTKNGDTFRTIANCEYTDNAVRAFLIEHYNFDGITSYSFKSTAKKKYKGVVNYRVK